jgi:hypothetical protein
MISILALAVLSSPSSPIKRMADADRFAAYGRDVLKQIRKEFYLADRHLYAQTASSKGPGKVCDNWSAGVLLSALDAAAEYDEKLKPQLREYATAFQSYWNTTGPVAGYAVLPGQIKPDRYYDDNEWMVLALIEASKLLKDSALEGQAGAALKYVLSGQDDRLGGGLYWHENEKTSKNTCSNAPAVVGILFAKRPVVGSEDLTRAIDIYSWVYRVLHDSETGLFWDNMSLAGKLDKTFWSYNTALMIDANALLFKATGNGMYGERSRLLERQSVSHWVQPDGAIADNAAFAHKLLESWLLRIELAPGQLEQLGQEVNAKRALVLLHDRIRDRQGHYPNRWDVPATKPLDEWQLINQASAARAFFLMALHLRGHVTPLGE